MDPDLHTLTGAYAVNALPDDERRMFERHLAACDACRREVAELRATAAHLGNASAEPAPAELRQRVLAIADTVRQDPPPSASAHPPAEVARPAVTRSPWVTWLGGAAAAVLIVAAVFLGGLTASLDHRIDELQTANQRLVDVLSAPDASTVAMQGAGEVVGRVVVVPSRGQAVFVAAGLPEVPQDQVYELWLISDETATPAGLFRPEDGRTHQVVTADLTRVTAIGVTVEPTGGSPQPTSDPVLLAPLEG